MPINLVCSATKSSMEVAMATAAGQLAAVQQIWKAAGQLAAVQQIWKAAGQLAAVQQIWKIWKKASRKLSSIALTDSSKDSSQITEQDTV